MFDQFTQTATQTATRLVTDAADKVTGSLDAASAAVIQSAQAALAKVHNVQLDLTDLDLSGVARLDPRRLGTIEFPKVDLPKVEFPRVDLPKVDLPDVDVPAEVGRVADLVRDVAYAGLGAAVITAQTVDANVRRVASRTA